MTTPTDDYYDLIGVDPTAPTDEIRDRYRERRSELDSRNTDDARHEAARLNRAWNVLSDPYQRGRYDAQRESGPESVAADDVEVLDGNDHDDDEPPRRRRLFEPSPRARERAAAAAVPVEYPGGHRAPENRRRVVAMVIDLLVLLLLFVVAQFVLQAVVKERFPAEVDRLDALTDQIDREENIESDLKDRADRAAAGDQAEADAAVREQEAKVERLKDDAIDIQEKFSGTYYAVVAGYVLVALVYLVVPSALTGQTLGKRLQRVRALRADGSPLGWVGALRRFGPIVLVVGIFLPTPLGQIVFVIGLVAVLAWMRNPNRQGWHDRFAKTIVVDAS